MITIEQFKDVCKTIVSVIENKRQISHIGRNINVEAIAFPYQPSPIIYLEGGITISYDDLGEFEQDFESVEKALDAFGYTVTRTLLDDENIPCNDINLTNVKKVVTDIINTPLTFAEEFVSKFDSQICLHKQCSRCNGTGNSASGPCIHHISCSCPSCSPR